MKKGIYLAIVMVAAGLLSCGGGSEVLTDSGMKYQVLKSGSEEIPAGDMVLVNFVVTDANDSVWMDSRLDEFPRPARKLDSVTTQHEGGLEEVIFYMKKGDSISCQVPVEKIYGPRAIPGVVAGSLLTVGLIIEDAMDKETFQAYSVEMRAKQLEINSKKAEEQLAIDIEMIDAYLSENNIVAQKTESGLRYVIKQEGEGAILESGQKAKVNYSGRVLNGAYFDSSSEEIAKEKGVYQKGRTYGPYETVIGQRAVIDGWDEAFQLMNKGTKATLYIPSGLGYGPRSRDAVIIANSILVFDVELVEIITE